MRSILDDDRDVPEDPRVQLAFAEHARLCREIDHLDQEPSATGSRSLLAALRMCRAHIEQELHRRGWRQRDGAWRPSV
ncbi:MAG: hypothetical protein ACFCGT_13975 [Sandaracinaceae bacterium]